MEDQKFKFGELLPGENDKVSNKKSSDKDHGKFSFEKKVIKCFMFLKIGLSDWSRARMSTSKLNWFSLSALRPTGICNLAFTHKGFTFNSFSIVFSVLTFQGIFGGVFFPLTAKKKLKLICLKINVIGR